MILDHSLNDFTDDVFHDMEGLVIYLFYCSNLAHSRKHSVGQYITRRTSEQLLINIKLW